MASQKIANYKDDAEIYQGKSLCKKKILELLDEIHMPRGLIPLHGVVEVGYNRTTGFLWLKRNKKLEQKNHKVGSLLSYDVEVTAFVEDRRMWKLTGVKSKPFLIWFAISETYVDDKDLRITFSTTTGFSKSFPISYFEFEEEQEKK